MIEKIITDKNVIKSLINRDEDYLIIQYNLKNKRAWFKTKSMIKRKPINLYRIINL